MSVVKTIDVEGKMKKTKTLLEGLHRYGISDKIWAVIAPLLPGRKKVEEEESQKIIENS